MRNRQNTAILAAVKKGQFDSGQFRRIDKNDIWLQAHIILFLMPVVNLIK